MPTDPPLATPKTPTPPSDRWLKIAGLLAIGSLPTFIIVVTLSALGVSLPVSGVLLFVEGIAGVLGRLPSWVTPDCPPWVAIVLGPVAATLGVAAIWGLVAYLKLLARVVRRVRPAHQPG